MSFQMVRQTDCRYSNYNLNFIHYIELTFEKQLKGKNLTFRGCQGLPGPWCCGWVVCGLPLEDAEVCLDLGVAAEWFVAYL